MGYRRLCSRWGPVFQIYFENEVIGTCKPRYGHWSRAEGLNIDAPHLFCPPPTPVQMKKKMESVLNNGDVSDKAKAREVRMDLIAVLVAILPWFATLHTACPLARFT